MKDQNPAKRSEQPVLSLGAEAVRFGLSVGRGAREPQCESVKRFSPVSYIEWKPIPSPWAQAVLNTLKNRLGKFSLELAEEKTRILPIGRFKGTKEDFDFLGFAFYNTTTRGGKYRLGIRSSKKKLKAKRQAAKEWLRTRLTKPVAETMKLLASIIRGHCNYDGVNGNFHAIQNFWKYLKYSTYRMLNRRDQKGKLKYLKFLRIWNYYIPEPHLTKDLWNWNRKVS